MDDDEPDEITAEPDALMHPDAPGGPDGCRVPPPLPMPPRRRRRRLTPADLALKYSIVRPQRLPGQDPDWILQCMRDQEISRRDLERLTAHGITLYPRSQAVYHACRRFLGDRTRKALNAIFESMGDDLDEPLLLAARDILLIEMGGKWVLTQRETMAVITPMMNPYCHSLDPYDHQCIQRGRMVATLICRRCGQVRTRLCMSDFNWMLRCLPESKLTCASSTPGNHEIVALVEAVRGIS